jgi:hypothetical protein
VGKIPTSFYKIQYPPPILYSLMVLELMELTQGCMTIVKYNVKFDKHTSYFLANIGHFSYLPPIPYYKHLHGVDVVANLE